LFLVFNRPECTKKVLLEIKKYRPTSLYIAADGPRKKIKGEIDKCNEVRQIIEKVDWPCRVKRLYRKDNLGCKNAVSSAIDWFFKNVSEGIILEDDCVPSASFFKFCEKMLSLYRDNRKVMHIGGVNFQKGEGKNKDGYYFSKYSNIWGWATWRRAWKGYDVKIKDWPEIKKSGKIDGYFDSWLEKEYWITLFSALYRGKIDTWDYQFVYHVWKNAGVSIVPNKNLVSNIGFGSDAVHTSSNKVGYANMQTHNMKVEMIGKKITIDRETDASFRNNILYINLKNVISLKLFYLK